MTQDIIEMAEEAGAFGYVHDAGEEPFKWQFSKQELEAFVELAAAKEREACAKVCEAERILGIDDERAYYGELMAAAIRARGEA